MEYVTVVLRLPVEDHPTREDLDSLLEIIQANGYTQDRSGDSILKLVVTEAGISAEGVTAAVLDAKRRAGGHVA